MAGLQKQYKSWLRHWYLAAKDERQYLTPEAKKKEPHVYREIQRMLGDEKVISKTASPLS